MKPDFPQEHFRAAVAKSQQKQMLPLIQFRKTKVEILINK